jgi:1-acyl-sn-glycerol-3-phosphate acyltransferase
MGPLLPDRGSRRARLQRRVRNIGIELVAFVVVTLTFPLLLAAALVVDLARVVTGRRKFVGVRLAMFLWWFLFGELRGLAGLAAIWLASGGRDSRTRRFRVYRLRQRWIGGHLDGVKRLFSLRFEVEGLDDVAPGPVVILMRHASIVDNALPDWLVGRRHDMGLRFVLKRELQMLPCIDIGGRWVPTSFVRRGSGDTASELEELRKIALDLDPHEGILIYPEGTRATPAKLERAKEIIAERQPDIAPLANELEHLLPPRLGGPLELIEHARGHDIVVCGHVGFDGYEHISDIWNGDLVGSTIRVRFQRFDRADVPADRAELTRWLYARWTELDAWIGEQLSRTGTTSP